MLAAAALSASSLGASAGARGDFYADRQYKYFSYLETLDYFVALKARCPEIIDTWMAQDEFPEILPASSKDWARCNGQICQTLLVRLTIRANLTTTTPELFFSGALHGDERVGPLVVTELAGFLCDGYRAGDEDVVRLLSGRSIWIAPMTNAHGYASNQREENGMDPNRDFPYLQDPQRCMMTQTGRAVNELFRRHLFHFMLTFHGGMRALTYEWGSRNHMVGRKSTESPDDHAFTNFGKLIQAASGTDRDHQKFYPLGRINDLVYPVDGGMEDWSYAAGWETSPVPITVCHPTTYGGYSPSRTVYSPGNIACLVYLAEMDNDKTPRSSTLGRTRELLSPSETDGHVARNMRMCLKMIELTRPEVVVQPPSLPAGLLADAALAVNARGFGCMTFSARLLLVPRAALAASASCALEPASWGGTDDGRAKLLAAAIEVAALSNVACGGLSTWEHPEAAFRQFQGVAPNVEGEFCYFVAAEFDQDWGQQVHPDPGLKPRSHAVRSRLEEHYTVSASDGQMKIDEFRTKLFPVFSEPVVISKAAGAAPSASPAPTSPDAKDFMVAEEEPATAIVPAAPGAPVAQASAPATAAPNVRPGIGLPLPSSLTTPDLAAFATGLSALFVALAAILAACNCVALHRRCASGRQRPRLGPPVPRRLEPEESSAMEQGAPKVSPAPAE